MKQQKINGPLLCARFFCTTLVKRTCMRGHTVHTKLPIKEVFSMGQAMDIYFVLLPVRYSKLSVHSFE